MFIINNKYINIFIKLENLINYKKKVYNNLINNNIF